MSSLPLQTHKRHRPPLATACSIVYLYRDAIRCWTREARLVMLAAFCRSLVLIDTHIVDKRSRWIAQNTGCIRRIPPWSRNCLLSHPNNPYRVGIHFLVLSRSPAPKSPCCSDLGVDARWQLHLHQIGAVVQQNVWWPICCPFHWFPPPATERSIKQEWS